MPPKSHRSRVSERTKVPGHAAIKVLGRVQVGQPGRAASSANNASGSASTACTCRAGGDASRAGKGLGCQGRHGCVVTRTRPQGFYAMIWVYAMPTGRIGAGRWQMQGVLLQRVSLPTQHSRACARRKQQVAGRSQRKYKHIFLDRSSNATVQLILACSLHVARACAFTE